MAGKSELVERMVRSTSMTRNEADAAVEALLDAVTDLLVEGERVKLPGFGSFWPLDRAARIGRNPRTGEKVDIPPNRGVKFNPGPRLKDRLNRERSSP